MKKGYLSQYFEGVAVKVLSAVEVNPEKSNQHEFNGVEELRRILGEPNQKSKFPTRFLYLSDFQETPIIEDGFLTWYDARQKARMERGVNRWEYRLYFPANRAIQNANAGDLLVIAKRQDDTLLAVVASSESTILRQILWLLGYSDLPAAGFSVKDNLSTEEYRIEFTSRFILESIGETVSVPEINILDDLLARFPSGFPKTREFSAYARSTLTDIHPQDGYDNVLMAWMEREEVLFRAMEKHTISQRLALGFNDDVDGFIAFSLSVQNRRKSRAGLALENHIENLFAVSGIQYARTAVTENKSKPDFIFPSRAQYLNPDFNAVYLTMLGVKSSCKDRWRQVLAEADRIERKHLLTLEAAISKSQTDEMELKRVQLVLPKSLHLSYLPVQQPWLMSVSDFIQHVLTKQKSYA